MSNKSSLSDLDQVLALALIATLHRGERLRIALRRLAKNLPHSRRVGLKVILISQDPRRVILTMLKDFDPCPTPAAT